MPAGTFSAFHRLRSDEVWHHYAGDPVDLHMLDAKTGYRLTVLGDDVAAGQRPQAAVPAGTWQAAEPRGKRFALCGCTVAPGFDFGDFEMPSRATLCALFPAQRELIEELTRNPGASAPGPSERSR